MNKNIQTRTIQRQRMGKLFVLPSCLIIFFFVVYPLIYTFYLSFCHYKFGYDAAPKFIGFKNYIDIFSDDRFLLSLNNTLLMACAAIILLLAFGLGIALLLFFKNKRTWLFRTAIFMPIVVPVSLICLLFRLMLSESFGAVNQFFINVLNMPQLARGWLTTKETARWAVIIVTLWNKIGFCAILYLAGLQGIPKDVLEAADIDGATGWRKLTRIILPNLSETHIVAGIWVILQSLKMFDVPMVLTNGGPVDATLVTYMYIYKNAFQSFDMGYAAAITFVFTVIIMTVALTNMRLNSRKD